jgi:hypothetical protein
MPDDNLFPDATPKTETPPGDPPKGNGADPAGEAPLSGAAIAQLISDSNAPLAAQIEKLAEATAAAAAAAQTPAPPPPQDTGAPPEDFLTRFANDPEAAIREVAGGQMQVAVPLMSGLINSTVANFIGRETADIDRDFGKGAWDKFFDKPLGVLMDGYRKSNVAALADDSTIRREVDGLKGRMFNELVEFREASRKTETEGTEADTKKLVDGVTETVIAQTNLSGGIRRISGGEEEITEGVKGYLAERIAAIGGDETGKDFLARTDYGDSIEDYMAHQKKLEAASGGAS